MNCFFDCTSTQVGKSLLKFELTHPLVNIDEILERQQVFLFLSANSE